MRLRYVFAACALLVYVLGRIGIGNVELRRRMVETQNEQTKLLCWSKTTPFSKHFFVETILLAVATDVSNLCSTLKELD